jgi:hypothetical protein
MGTNTVDLLRKVTEMERLKCGLLSNTADFFISTSEMNNNGELLSSDVLCDLLVNVYLLSAQVGLDYDTLTDSAVVKLRNMLLNNDNGALKLNENDVKNLLRHLVR